MSARIPSRRLGQSALAAFQPRLMRWVPSTSLPVAARRNISNPFRSKDDTPAVNKDQDLSNPILEKYLRQREIEQGLVAEDDTEKTGPRIKTREGSLSKSPSSLFLPEREIPGWQPNLSPSEQAALKAKAEARREAIEAQDNLKLSRMNVDPDPAARRRLERRLVISSVKRHGRLTKAQTLARTERQSLYKSQTLPTSVKKLQKVVNQIAGKTVSEALVQLRFSKKRIARDVIKGLEIAQNEAIASRGMSLGSGRLAQERWEAQRAQTDMGTAKDVQIKPTQKKKLGVPATIELKDGRKKVVRDPSEIYIEQAWVGKGESWKSPEYRARGQMNLLTHRTTSFSVLLKEEKTRMRISEEIKKKREKRKLWTALPDRPVTTQRQYCLW
ncbi:ribosomal protein L22/L17 [Paraphoma chrysanthemicola]|uniref:Ribosomal protein L22/L17 n=1 Tax=Paraphoma chrysanthemicola TaxID=798071 RepID=A0A8K0R2Q1_9PLEO|nr:ribosomal protein L22/L17 [Paraphoma chrysanthemicola]